MFIIMFKYIHTYIYTNIYIYIYIYIYMIKIVSFSNLILFKNLSRLSNDIFIPSYHSNQYHWIHYWVLAH